LWSRGGAWRPTPVLKMEAGGGGVSTFRAKDLVGTKWVLATTPRLRGPLRGVQPHARPRVHVLKFSSEVLLARGAHGVVGGHRGGGYRFPLFKIIDRGGRHQVRGYHVVTGRASRARARIAREWPGGEPGHLHFVLSNNPRLDNSLVLWLSKRKSPWTLPGWCLAFQMSRPTRARATSTARPMKIHSMGSTL